MFHLIARPANETLRRFGALALALSLIAGCADLPDPDDAEAVAEYEEVNDPGEPTMRAIFSFNRVIDKVILKPSAEVLRETPASFQRGVHNFLNNLHSPVIFFNDILQGEFERAGTTLARFLVNSTIGILGFMDQAKEMGLEFHNEDFGQTLAVWNIPEGPYLMLPVFGPSNPRDTVGLVVDFLLDPFNWLASNTDNDWATWARAGVRGVDQRARHFDALEDLEKSSLDFYAAIRSLYRQHREDEISNGESSSFMEAPTMGMDIQIPSADDGEVSQK